MKVNRMPIIGTCGNCGGAVRTPDAWHGITAPTPECEICHSTPKESFGVKIEMKPKPNESAK